LSTDDELVDATVNARPTIVSIDSPLSLPSGRLEVYDTDPTRHTFGIMRQCERELKRRGINVYPCLLPSMQALTKRGIMLASRFRKLGLPVIESYPGAAQDIVGIPRKGAGTELLTLGMSEFGILGQYSSSTVTHDELDAITCALVGHFFLAGKYEALSGPNEGALIIPKLSALNPYRVFGFSGRISAGKTTASRILESEGFAYTRFSLAVDEEIIRRGFIPDRAMRQKIGQEIHESRGQRWLAEQTIRLVGDKQAIVVDGLRFPEDHCFLVESFGSNFRHVHVTSDRELRRERYEAFGDQSASFDAADNNLVEIAVDSLATLAHCRIENSGTIEAFGRSLKRLIALDLEE
jgi:predicted nuclease with RNAse H fold/dephospho-CoA kinase